ncbi:hypothetical protein FJV41_06575 [Myxococcus llanfairpwllgwyngyllgogerychwyrndrobwllllantysiliogogogochensis]|uniref:Uncharacterized protein n=1 Tax=Myxococcus llanfairpwllgwyngyllgogerychwyrndrobwllllantysiliogogogochensis TaxID=2590453 RepID=A0A540X818_9BACT|nr:MULTISPECIES: DapH/DapD/GlmU-related protein [Myxococcus]NTX41613.1 hypothetical protein [Myxococcus sp. CA033]TQF16814.1 hypothetical protein FJV41_06575 [Myxococcus llanfairpwllgwyngyllgogerychwyrndrobwllllantysiliogogogochensis]
MTQDATDALATARQRFKHQSRAFGLARVLLVDLITMAFALPPGLVAWWSCLLFLRWSWDRPGFAAWALLAPGVLAGVFLATCWLMRLCIPRMRPGTYAMELSRDYLAWYSVLCLGHAVRICGLQPFFFTFYVTKYLYWRAMGARIAYGVNSSLFAILADYPLLTIGKGCTMGANVFVLGHVFLGDKVQLGEVNIGDNVFLGAGAMVGPRTTIGARSWIGINNKLLKDTLPEDSRLENFEWEHFNPARAQVTPAPQAPTEASAP